MVEYVRLTFWFLSRCSVTPLPVTVKAAID
jgi:hypothetical protein